MSINRVAIIFDNTVRPETTGLYGRRALGELVEVEHFLPAELGEIAAERFDLVLQVDDGLRYRLPEHLPNRAFWAIDTHIDFEAAMWKAEAANIVFAAQKNGAEGLVSHGVDARWLPLACDPELHGRRDVPERFDVAFVGNVFPGPRNDLLRLIRDRYPRTFVGQRYFEEMAETYSSARVVFNRSVADDVNMRVFEGLASRSLLLTNDLSVNGQSELFQDGVHLATYGDADDLLEKLAWYLKHDEVRRRIARCGYEKAVSRHTYRHRMAELLRIAESVQSAVNVPVELPVSRRQVEPETAATPTKHASYFEHVRPEILDRIPRDAKRILDVGCGAGRLGEVLKRRQACDVWGVERDRAVAESAQTRIDRVVCANAESLNGEFAEEVFDCVVCGDVLEHLRDPRSFLVRAREWLSSNGRIVASIPNVRHHSVLRSLMDGNWTYEPAGLLDEDHVRFFTRREIEKTFFRAGYTVQRITTQPGPGHAEWVAQERPREVTIGGLSYRARDERDAEELFAYQYVVEAVPADQPDFGLTSIVIVTHNQLQHTHACVESIRHLTDEPYELIFVDNASTDGTPEYLESIPGATVFRNAENRGFPAAVNQGIETSRGEQVLLLNNDTVVTTGWLRRMLAALHEDESIGLVGPLSNNVSGEQQIPVPYDDPAALDGFAWELSQANGGRRTDTDRLVGFCLMIKRAVIDAVGGLDEQFGIGNFEDDDFCRRAQQAGFRSVIAHDTFVHHVGGATFRGAGVDFAALMEENRRKYEAKWSTVIASEEGNGENILQVDPMAAPNGANPKFLLDESADGGLLLRTADVKLSLCMIVRDNERTIRPALESIRPWVDEMIVVDTGSTDRTPDICRELGARVEHFKWCHDFSAARNASLKYARGDWIFWMDSDDTIPAECGRRLRALADNGHPDDRLGYIMQVHCPSANDAGDMTVVDHVKLFRNRSDLRFEHRIHEQILPAIRRANGEVAFTDICVVHSGSDRTPEGRARKLERDYRLLELDLQERPDHPFVLFNLGMTYDDDQRYDEAIRHLKRCLEVSQPDESHLRKAYALLVHSEQETGRSEDALKTCEAGLEHFPDDAELLFRRASLHQATGSLDAAITDYESILESRGRTYLASFDPGIFGHKARHNLALVYEAKSDFEKARECWEAVIAERPETRVAWRALVHLHFERGEQIAARSLIERMKNWESLDCEREVLASRLSECEGDFKSAQSNLEAAAEKFSEDAYLLQELGRLLFEQLGPAAAEGILVRLARCSPQDAATHHNLGSVYLATGCSREAVKAFERSLELRPNSPATQMLLKEALRQCGRMKEAAGSQRRINGEGTQDRSLPSSSVHNQSA